VAKNQTGSRSPGEHRNGRADSRHEVQRIVFALTVIVSRLKNLPPQA
jgi:hypothetical protein